MSDEQLWRWFEQFRDGPAGPMRMPAAHKIRRRARIWWATRLGGALAVAVLVVCAVPLVARQLGGDRTPTALGRTSAPSSTPVPIPTRPRPSVPEAASAAPNSPEPPHPTLPHSSVTSPASDTVQIQPTSVRPGQTVTLSGQGCTTPRVKASQLLVQVDVESPDGNDRVAWLQYPVRSDGSWQGRWHIPKPPTRIRYGPGSSSNPPAISRRTAAGRSPSRASSTSSATTSSG
jgi:hypothetical protein